jgi:hypothetical protein
MLEAVLRYGYVLSVEDRVVFIPREAVVQMELFDTNQRTAQRASTTSLSTLGEAAGMRTLVAFGPDYWSGLSFI